LPEFAGVAYIIIGDIVRPCCNAWNNADGNIEKKRYNALTLNN
jgi:hypothetical protein